MKLYVLLQQFIKKSIMHIIFSLSVLDISWYYLEIIQSPLSRSLSRKPGLSNINKYLRFWCIRENALVLGSMVLEKVLLESIVVL
jgi:hypothetical protein